MTPLEERNLVWHMIELIIAKHNLNSDMELLEPHAEDLIEFGNFVSGNPMGFELDYKETIIEIERKLPSDYQITKAVLLGTGDGVIAVSKI